MNRFDKLAEEWDLEPRRVLMAKNTFNEIQKKVSLLEEMEVHDIGTGTGLLLLNFVDKVRHITGTDNSKEMLDILANKLKQSNIKNTSLKLFDADIDNLPINSYDLTVSNMTFHHIQKPADLIKRIYSSLRSGGKICIADLETENGTFHSKQNLKGVYHFGFDKNEFLSWLEEANFINTTIETIFKIDKEGRKFPVFLAYGEKT